MSYTRPQRPMGPAEHDELSLIETKIDALLLLFDSAEIEVSIATFQELQRIRDDIHQKRHEYQLRLLSKFKQQ
jgi:hypothetical protein